MVAGKTSELNKKSHRETLGGTRGPQGLSSGRAVAGLWGPHSRAPQSQAAIPVQFLPKSRWETEAVGAGSSVPSGLQPMAGRCLPIWEPGRGLRRALGTPSTGPLSSLSGGSLGSCTSGRFPSMGGSDRREERRIGVFVCHFPPQGSPGVSAASGKKQMAPPILGIHRCLRVEPAVGSSAGQRSQVEGRQLWALRCELS